MRRIVYLVLVALLFTVLGASTVLARGNIRLGNVEFSLGSLIAKGDLTGLANQSIKINLEASGFPLVTCTSPGGNSAPGQSYPKVSASGQQILDGDDRVTKNGKSLFAVETDDPPNLNPTEYGCPNENWTAEIDFVYWEGATISVSDPYTGAILLKQDYTCVTILTSVACVPTN